MKLKRQIVYESAPYRSKWGLLGRLWNVYKAVKDARTVAKQGYCVFVPHLWALLDPLGQVGEDFWLQCGLKMIPKCQIIRMRKGWEKSAGAWGEWYDAQQYGLKVWYEGEDKPAEFVGIKPTIIAENKPYICHTCNVGFKTIEELDEHMKTHDYQVPYPETANGTIDIAPGSTLRVSNDLFQ